MNPRSIAAVSLAALLFATGFPQRVPAASASYLIHGGDQISVQLVEDPTYLPAPVTVLGDGSVVLPLAGRIVIGGLTQVQADAKIARALAPYVRHPHVNVAIAVPGPIQVTVLGNVKTPGRYTLSPDAHVLDAVAAAGGIAEVDSASYPDARIAEPGGKVQTVPLQGLLHDGDTALDVPLDQGAVVYVPGRMTFSVEVIGAVDKPGEIQLQEGDRLSMAIAKAGDSRNANADLNRIELTRHFPNGQTGTYRVDLYQALQRGDERYDVALKPGDTIFVPEGNGNRSSSNTMYSVLYLLGALFHI